MWKSITGNNKRILSEAPIQGEDFQLTNDDLGEGEEQQGFQSNDIPDQTNPIGQGQESDPTMGEPGMEGEENPAMGEDPNMNPEGDMGGGFTEPEIPEETEEDRLKKLILLKQYKALYERLSDVKFTLTYIKRMQEYKDDENIEYIEDQLEDIDEKINDTLAHHFLSSPYRDLLRLFYYLKYQTVSLTDMLAKVTGASLDVSKNPNNKDKKKK